MRKLQLLICGALLIGGVAACSQQDIDASNTRFAENDQQIKTYATAKNLNGKTTNSGLYYVITSPTTGKLPSLGEEVEFMYKSYNLQDVLIDSTVSGKPVYYPLGIQSILAGLEEGVGLMHEGENATFLIPSYLGYGNNAVNANLPAYSVVRFDVQLNRSRTEDQQIRQYIADRKLVVSDSSSTGVRVIKTKANPTGAALGASQTVTIKYVGRQLRAAAPFDSTGQNFDAVLGGNRYVKGFEEGLSKLRVGETATILFPSTVGYGTTGVISGNSYKITPYAPLRFDIQVISVK